MKDHADRNHADDPGRGNQMSDQMPPIRKVLHVPIGCERAFELFTREMDTWWPLETHGRYEEVDGAKPERIEFPDRAGGEILEHLSTGETLPWGELLVFEPPSRLVIAWKPHPRPTPPTEVEVTFTPDGDGTRVELVHRGWERLGDQAAEAMSGYDTGWDAVLGRFVRAAA